VEGLKASSPAWVRVRRDMADGGAKREGSGSGALHRGTKAERRWNVTVVTMVGQGGVGDILCPRCDGRAAVYTVYTPPVCLHCFRGHASVLVRPAHLALGVKCVSHSSQDSAIDASVTERL
jgi:hypothetical protein